MLSYQHGYHAGNFADVVKHLTLTRILHYLLQKEKPLFYLETHAGRGLYSLNSTQSRKTLEHQQGIDLIWQNRNDLSPLFHPFLQVLHHFNTEKDLQQYPGSPSFAIHLLRQQDRLYCCELHPREFDFLNQLQTQKKRVFFSHRDGIESLKALLPPMERRGLIFVDPSYEIKTDYKNIPKALEEAYRQFSTGVYCLWYPLVDPNLNQQLERNMRKIDASTALRCEFHYQSGTKGMQGCGLWIINPPYTLAAEMKAILQQLSNFFNPGISTYSVEVIK